MQEKYRKHMQWWLDEFCAGDQVDKYVELFPELDSRLAKFAVGIFLWNMNGLIDIDNPDDVSKVRLILKVVDQTPGYDFFDNVFNEADPDTVCQIIGMSPVTPIEEGDIDFDYSVTEIKNFEEARLYFEAVSWCIVISEESFKEYTGNGNRFYFCGNGDWWDTPCVPGMDFPHDKYGYSLIAVEVTPDNRIASVTSRWNTCAGDTGDFLSPDELQRVLGESNYKKLFLYTL
ncbi:MAG: hypothetical protein HDR83_04935 [Bacteroides sp.]|nr:hypothetical protein [Bacteroides sp.]MBD5368589.1 hypothetical protein [Bacteroides sp.]